MLMLHFYLLDDISHCLLDYLITSVLNLVFLLLTQHLATQGGLLEV